MTTMDAIVLLLLAEALLAISWHQWLKARQYGSRRTKPPERPLEAKSEGSGTKGPLLDPSDRA